jgi:hypothetical protein
MSKLKKHLENKKGFVAIKNIIALIFVWLLLLTIHVEINRYFLCKQFEKTVKQFVFNGRTLEEIEKDNDKMREISIEVVNLTNCPNLETIDLDNQKILNYMAKDTVKDAANFLESRAKALKQAKQKDGMELYYLMKNVRTTVINPDVSDLIRSYNLPKNFDKDLLEKVSHSVIVEGTLMVFDKQSGQKVISKDIRQLVILTPRKPTIEKPNSYEVDWLIDSSRKS